MDIIKRANPLPLAILLLLLSLILFLCSMPVLKTAPLQEEYSGIDMLYTPMLCM